MSRSFVLVFALAFTSSLPIGAAFALSASDAAPLTLAQAVDTALAKYPSVRVSQEQMNAAAAQIRLARTSYLPHADALAQFNRATRNNVFGLLLPQSTIPNISGPVLGTDNLGSVWGSAVGVLVSWQPFDFGLRRANIATAQAGRDRAQAASNRTQFEVSVAAADAFLTLLAAQETARAAQAAVDRWGVLERTTHALVSSQLRPGADESRVQAEMAMARTQLSQAEQAIDVAGANLSQFLGSAPPSIRPDPGRMLSQFPEPQPASPFNTAANPLAIEQQAVIRQEQSRIKALDRTYTPQFALQGAASARGSGAGLDGVRLGGWNGLAPNYQNYALGVSVTFNMFELPSIRAQESAQTANLRAAEAQSDQIRTTLQAQWKAAQAALSGARQVAQNTPVEIASARTALDQATARYKAGLSPVDDVAQAERLLVQAQIDDALAHLNVWRAFLQLKTAEGDIHSFVTEASR